MTQSTTHNNNTLPPGIDRFPSTVFVPVLEMNDGHNSLLNTSSSAPAAVCEAYADKPSQPSTDNLVIFARHVEVCRWVPAFPSGGALCVLIAAT